MEEVASSKITWKVSDDRLSILCRVTGPVPERDKAIEETVREIRDAGVIVETDREALLQAIQDITPDWVIIGTGTPPVPPTPGKLEFFVDASHLDHQAAKDETGNVDYKDLRLFINVTKGQELVRKHDPIPGKSGKDVYGHDIDPPNPAPIFIPIGSGVELVEDDHLAIATEDGAITTKGQKVSVTQFFPVSGDVSYKTGNIDFNGTVEISGSVLAGFNVRAEGDIVVEGLVEPSEIHADGSVTVRGGFQGGERGIIKSGESIQVKFAAEGRIEAQQSVFVKKSLLHCEVLAHEGSVIIDDKGGVISGGIVKASKSIEADMLGSDMGAKTVLQIGLTDDILRQTSTTEDELEQLEKQLRDTGVLVSKLDAFKKKVGALPPVQEENRVKAVRTQFMLKGQVEAAQKNLRKLKAEMESLKEGIIRAKDTVFQGVTIRFGSAVYIVDHPLRYTEFFYERGEIHTRAL